MEVFLYVELKDEFITNIMKYILKLSIIYIALCAFFASCNKTEYYQLQVISNGGGSVFCENGCISEHAAGTRILVEAQPDEEYRFIGWYINETDTCVSEELVYTFEIVDDTYLEAKFEEDVYEVYIYATDGGHFLCEDVVFDCFVNSVPNGSIMSLTAIPDEEFVFMGWYQLEKHNENMETKNSRISSKNLVSKDSVYVFTVQRDIDLIAGFSRAAVISLQETPGGRISFKESSEMSLEVPFGDTLTIVATPNEYCEFLGWYSNGLLISYDIDCTFAAEGNMDITAIFRRLPNVVDLGLSVSWADINIGAYSSNDFGTYYSYNEGCYAAESSWDGDWRLPNAAELHELQHKCSWEKTEMEGVNGYRVVGPNGNELFLPAAGYSHYGYSWVNQSCLYWSSTACGFYSDHAYHLYAEEDLVGVYRYVSNAYMPLRPVCGQAKAKTVMVEVGSEGTVDIKVNDEARIYGYIGEEVTLSAIPAEGYAFAGWRRRDSNMFESTEPDYTFTLEDDVELYAEFCEFVTLSVRSAGNGEVSIDNSLESILNLAPGTTVTVVAEPQMGYEFLGWYLNDKIVSSDLHYTFDLTEDVDLVGRFVEEGLLVDLGLPSGLKWAVCNVGASSPEETGGYYAWGETKEKSEYTWYTYSFAMKDSGYWRMLKYSGSSKVGPAGGWPGDDRTELEPEDDPAAVLMGESWRTPKYAEMQELKSECEWEKSTFNGVIGYTIIGPNGNSIFLPAVGYRSENSIFEFAEECYYWTSSVNGMGVNRAYSNIGRLDRYYGLPVRAVYK